MRRIDNCKRRRLRLNYRVRPDIIGFLSNALLPLYPKIRKILRLFAGVAIFTGFLAAGVFLFFGAQAGCLKAKYDLLRDHYEIRAYGYSRSHENAYRKLLKTYGIEYRYVDISPFNPFTTDFVAAYNSTMKKAIRSNLYLDVESLLRLFRVLETMEDDTSRIQTSPVEFYEQILPQDPDFTGNEEDEPLVLMQTQKPPAGSPDFFKLSECQARLRTDLNGDSVSEDICLRELRFKEWDRRFMKRSLVVDVYQKKEKILRQELNLGAFWQEKFLEMADVNADNRKELVTTVKFGPQCAGCGAHRVYGFEKSRFEPVLQLFGVEPDNPLLRMAFRGLRVFEARLLGVYRKQSGLEHPCGYLGACAQSGPWLIDRDGDCRHEILLLAMPPYQSGAEVDRFINIVIGKVAADGRIADIRLYPTSIPCCDGFVDLLGFLKTRDGRTHLLVNFAYAGTGSDYPVLHIFDIGPVEVNQIGKFAGFYEHVIAERLKDLNRDGNTEIIYVEDVYWPPGASHAEVIPIYGIATYLNGQYQEADKRFGNAYKELNQQLLAPGLLQ